MILLYDEFPNESIITIASIEELKMTASFLEVFGFVWLDGPQYLIDAYNVQRDGLRYISLRISKVYPQLCRIGNNQNCGVWLSYINPRTLPLDTDIRLVELNICLENDEP